MESQKKLRRPRRQFTDEFKAGAVRLVLVEGKSVTQVSRDLDSSRCRQWVSGSRAGPGQPGPEQARHLDDRGEGGVGAASGKRCASFGWRREILKTI